MISSADSAIRHSRSPLPACSMSRKTIDVEERRPESTETVSSFEQMRVKEGVESGMGESGVAVQYCRGSRRRRCGCLAAEEGGEREGKKVKHEFAETGREGRAKRRTYRFSSASTARMLEHLVGQSCNTRRRGRNDKTSVKLTETTTTERGNGTRKDVVRGLILICMSVRAKGGEIEREKKTKYC